jgi:hypothetical protein
MYRHRTSSVMAGVIAPSTDLISHAKNAGNGLYPHDRMAPAGSRLQGPAVLATALDGPRKRRFCWREDSHADNLVVFNRLNCHFR